LYKTAKAERSGGGIPRRRRVQDALDGSGQAGQPEPWKRERDLSGKWISQAGSVEGARNPTGGGTGTPEGCIVAGEGANGSGEGEVLEGEYKATSGIRSRQGNLSAGGSTEDARAQAERLQQGEGGAWKPNDRLRRIVTR
jgi:hypothetical protein